MAHRVTRVHVVFKTHLDIGFTDLAARVVARYCDTFIPNAIETARALRDAGGVERFIWTTGRRSPMKARAWRMGPQ